MNSVEIEIMYTADSFITSTSLLSTYAIIIIGITIIKNKPKPIEFIIKPVLKCAFCEKLKINEPPKIHNITRYNKL